MQLVHNYLATCQPKIQNKKFIIAKAIKSSVAQLGPAQLC